MARVVAATTIHDAAPKGDRHTLDMATTYRGLHDTENPIHSRSLKYQGFGYEVGELPASEEQQEKNVESFGESGREKVGINACTRTPADAGRAMVGCQGCVG